MDKAFYPQISQIFTEYNLLPMDRINPDTLRKTISEFVTREWEELGDRANREQDGMFRRAEAGQK